MKQIFTTIITILITVTVMVSQGCENPYPLGEMGTWSECWDAPQTFSDDYFEAWPETDLCGNQYGGVWLEFTTNATGIAIFTISSDMNYTFCLSCELWVHFYILSDCTTPIFFTGGCGIYPDLGTEYFISSTGDGSTMGIDTDYTIELQMAANTTYYMVTATAGGTETVQESVEGCLTVEYFSPDILEITILPTFEITTEPFIEKDRPTLIRVTDLLNREVNNFEPFTVYIFQYSDGTIKKRIIIQ